MVRAFALVCVLLACLPAAAQVVVEDSRGDQRLSMPSGQFRLPAGGQFPHVDIVEAGVWRETPEDLTFFVRPDTIATQSETPVPYSDPVYDIRFLHGLQGYRVLLRLFLENPGTGVFGDPETTAQLQVEVEADVFEPLADGVAEIDVAEGVVLATVPRAPILDHNQAPLALGGVLSGFSATAVSMGWFGFGLPTNNGNTVVVGPPRAYDRAPDSAFDDGQYVMQTGEALHQGAIVAGTADPVRWTNGEATTFVYRIRLTNAAAHPVQVTTTIEDTDPTWQVAYSDRFTVPAHDHINVTLHVAIPFSHQHGLLRMFKVHFTSPDETHRATARLGVYWPIVPQPAGHHDTLWFHTARFEPANPFEGMGSKVHGWLSAADAEVDVRDEQAPLPPDTVDPRPEQAQAHWRLLLEPGLRMGLDFDLSRTGSATIAMDLPLAMQDPSLRLEIRHYDMRFIIPRVTTIASETATLTGQVSGPVTWEFPTITPREAADLIRYVSHADLEFNVTLMGTVPGLGPTQVEGWVPTLRPAGSILQLPLLEYHDPLEATFQTTASAKVTPGALGIEREVNAGKKVVYNMTLAYYGAFEQDFIVELSGHQDWARVLGAARFTMRPGDVREVAIVVEPPSSAPPGTYDTTIRCISVQNAAVQAGMVVRTTVVPGDGLEDETALAEQKALQLEDEPSRRGFPWLWLLLPLVVVAGGAGAVWKFKPDWLPWT